MSGAVDAGGRLPSRLLLLLDDALAHVFLQRRRDREGHLAEAAAVDVLAEPAVGLHVTGQLGALGARVAAQFTFIRFLARVRSPVHRQIAAVFEDFAAEFARVVAPGLLLAVDAAAADAAAASGAAD